MQTFSISTTLPQIAYWYPARMCRPLLYVQLSHKQHTGILQECADLYYMCNTGILQYCAHLQYMHNSPTNSILISCKSVQTFSIRTTFPQSAFCFPVTWADIQYNYVQLSHKQHTGILQECADLYYMYNTGILQDCAHLQYMHNSPTNSILVSCKSVQIFSICTTLP